MTHQPPQPKTPEAEAQRLTPMMAQYVEIKAANPDSLLFYRMGDFYELFFPDAEVASRALGIVLTKRGKHLGEDIPMCGVPIERSDDYLQRLIGLGHRVAVCEQMEDPAEAKKRGPKSVVRRDVVRLVTPGTITEDRLLDPARANVLMALARVRGSQDDWIYGLAAADISTGAFETEALPRAELAALLARLEPAEVLAPKGLAPDSVEVAIPRDATRKLTEAFGVHTLDGFGSFTAAEITAAAMALDYVKATQRGALPRLSRPVPRGGRGLLQMDAATRRSLEILRPEKGGSKDCLLGAVDRTITAAGARELAARLASPLAEPAEIGARHDAVHALLLGTQLRATLRATLKGAPDMARALARLSLDRFAPRDLAAQLTALLAEATGERWTIALSNAEGEPTLAVQGKLADASRRELAASHPLVQAILAAFPGASIQAVRAEGTDAYGLAAAPVIAAEPEPDTLPEDMPEFAPPEAEPVDLDDF